MNAAIIFPSDQISCNTGRTIATGPAAYCDVHPFFHSVAKLGGLYFHMFLMFIISKPARPTPEIKIM